MQDGKAQNVEEFINSQLHGLESDCVGKVDKLLGVTQVGESTIPQYLRVALLAHSYSPDALHMLSAIPRRDERLRAQTDLRGGNLGLRWAD